MGRKHKSFDNLNDTFNVEDGIECMVENTVDSKPSGEFKAGQKYSLSDLGYYKTELQDRIESDRIVCEELKNCCKVGAAPRIFDVYAKLSLTISDNIMKLVEIEKQMTDYQVVESKEKMRQQELDLKEKQIVRRMEKNSKTNTPHSVTQINNNTYNISSKDLLAKVIDEVEDEDCVTDPAKLPTYDFS